MLLNLLKPEICIAYHKARQNFPVQNDLRKFIGAGINLRKSGVMDFGNLILQESTQQAINELALQCGDFLNYWIVADLLQTLSAFKEYGSVELSNQIGLNLSEASIDAFALEISNDPCWFGYLLDIDTFERLKRRVSERIVTYRKYINLNLDDDKLPQQFLETKTVIGNPIAKVAEIMRKHKIIDEDVEVFVRIDQYEQLPTLNISGHNFGALCQELVHKALSSRDVRVSYRIGTRHYAWPDTPKIFGTNDILENKRDYSSINIDTSLRRKENARTWIFPSFARDIFRRRLLLAKISQPKIDGRAIEKVFGQTLDASERAKKYVPTDQARVNALKPADGFPSQWISFVEKLAIEDPLAAKFADAWVRQTSKSKKSLVNSPPVKGALPWDKKPYWKKERTEQALVQIASANRQQAIWGGANDVIGLSGGTILVFLSICQHIWDAWLRDTRGADVEMDTALPSISIEVQSQGIREASEEWVNKVKEGDDATRRSQFLRNIGPYYYRQLIDDKAMSYPGVTGFSLNTAELNQAREVHRFLKTCVEYGDLYEAPHTSKHKGEARVKYYLAPILCPYFRIPYQRTKEPDYIHVSKIIEWMERPALNISSPEKNQIQFDMFNRPTK